VSGKGTPSMTKRTARTKPKPGSKYVLTDAHRAKLKPWADRWIANAMSTATMTAADQDATRVAINGLYDAAKLERPERIVFVPGPVTGVLAACIAAGVWYLRENPGKHVALFGRHVPEVELMSAIAPTCARAVRAARYRLETLRAEPAPAPVVGSPTDAATRAATDAATYAATRAATYAATRAATNAATYAATRAATSDATDAATHAATSAATDAATDAATRAATNAATYAATYAATDDATNAATYAATSDADLEPLVAFLLRCCAYHARMWNGGNHWSGWCAYLSFFRHVAKLPLDYSKWQHYEAAAVHASHRWMHAKFCIVSDRPEVLRIDGGRLPHCEDGPSHRWRDGFELYHWRGTRVPKAWIADKASLAPETAINWPNVEQRRVAAEIVGWPRILEQLGATVVHRDPNPQIGTLLRADLPDSPGEQFLQVKCGTGRDFALPVPPSVRTAMEAQEWMWGLEPGEYQLEVRT
jgi:hypothetical protein